MASADLSVVSCDRRAASGERCVVCGERWLALVDRSVLYSGVMPTVSHTNSVCV